jgi:hypothetical protein
MQKRQQHELIDVAKVLACIECGRLWRDPSERWRMYVTDDEPPEAVPYCQSCASREFDP